MLRDLFSLFPACAGVILLAHFISKRLNSFPRMCGGDPNMERLPLDGADFSPHVRG